ncbi:MAG: nucleoside monophosphate kinase [archaeon]|nr:nucleoside monophosphate kinase [archaeon]
MDRTEKLQYEQSIEQYFDNNKVYDLFEKLFKELIINQPENPIDYLIERLRRKETKRIFITGYPGTGRKDVSLAVGEAMNYSCLSVDHLLEREISKKLENAHQIEDRYNAHTLVDDDIVIDLVRNKLIGYEEGNSSYIIEGFPRNRVQAIFLQSVGLLPDNVIILKTSREKAEAKVLEKLKAKNPDKSEEDLQKMAKASVDEAELNIRAVEDVFSGFYCELPVDKFQSNTEVIDELGKLLKFKAKTNAMRRPPRIILACPPSSGKEAIAKRLAAKLQIIHVSVTELLKKEILKKNANSREILETWNENNLVPDKYILKLLEDRLYCSDCMINGWIVTGFPMCESQINFIENMNPAIKPSLVALIDMDEKVICEKAAKIRYDPMTGRLIRLESKKYNALTEDEKERLVRREQDNEERLKKRINNWKKVTEILINKNCLKLNGEEKKKKICQLIEDAISYNS